MKFYRFYRDFPCAYVLFCFVLGDEGSFPAILVLS